MTNARIRKKSPSHKVTYTDRVRLEGELEMVYGPPPNIIARKISKAP